MSLRRKISVPNAVDTHKYGPAVQQKIKIFFFKYYSSIIFSVVNHARINSEDTIELGSIKNFTDNFLKKKDL